MAAEKKILVVYYSRADENYSVGNISKGNTEIIAEMIAKKTGGTLLHVEPAKEYPKGYDDCINVAKKERRNLRRLPGVVGRNAHAHVHFLREV